MRQITGHVCRRPRLAIKADGGGILLLPSASYVENKHDVSFLNRQRPVTRLHQIENTNTSSPLFQIRVKSQFRLVAFQFALIIRGQAG